MTPAPASSHLRAPEPSELAVASASSASAVQVATPTSAVCWPRQEDSAHLGACACTLRPPQATNTLGHLTGRFSGRVSPALHRALVFLLQVVVTLLFAVQCESRQ